MRNSWIRIFILVSIFHFPISCSQNNSENNEVNYDEDRIKPYELPDLMILDNGRTVNNSRDWEEQRRPEILVKFENEVYGKVPGQLDTSTYMVIEQSDSALDNTAIRKQVSLNFSKNGKQLEVMILMYLPAEIDDPTVFIGYNFYGNHTITNDPDVVLTKSWVRNSEDLGITDNQASEVSRGARTNRWPVEKILNAGFGLVTIYYGDVDPDKNDFTDGIHPLFYENGQTHPAEDEWGSISAWAWGLSRIRDYLQEDGDTENSKVIVMGHSRLGKTALWAGARDQRFDLVISNDSGCGGAAIFRRKFGETASAINESFPHWFCTNFKAYNQKEENLPVDQHMLIALIAPRPVYIASAENDQWADPKGEYLAGYYAGPVYELYGKTGLENPVPPPINQPILNHSIGYHIRTGDHDITDYDWDQFIQFAKKHLEWD